LQQEVFIIYQQVEKNQKKKKPTQIQRNQQNPPQQHNLPQQNPPQQHNLPQQNPPQHNLPQQNLQPFNLKIQKPRRCHAVLIAGPPGSGKGTQCDLVVNRLGYNHISTGDLLREAVKNRTDLGLQAEGYMAQGKLVPDDLVINLVKVALSSDDVIEHGYLLDGFPRTLNQAKAMHDSDIIPEKLIVLETPDDILFERITGRRLDPDTNKTYHIKFNPPPNDEVAGRLIQRDDDTEEKLKTRLDQYHENIQLIKEFYGENFMVEIINADRPVEAVYADVAFSLLNQ